MSRNAPLITWDNLIGNAKTGDLILCDGQSLLSQAIEWLTWGDFSHIGMVVTDPEGVAAAIAAYTERYQAPRERPGSVRVAIEIAVDRILGRG